jgi:hypothetical protein
VNAETDFAEYLSEQARSATAAIHEFRLLYEEGTVHVFFEGDEDFLYYLPEVRARLRQRVLHSYRCGGKWNVVEVRDFIRNHQYDKALCLYFLDRDYDDLFCKQPITDQETYISDDYSIENSLVGADAIEVILVDLTKLSRADPRYKSIKALFPKAHAAFVGKLESLLAWSVALRNAGGKPNYNNINLGRIFKVGADGSIQRKAGAFEIYKKAVLSPPTAAQVPVKEILRWLRILRKLPPKQRIRGKYELWFFETYLSLAIRHGPTAAKVPAALQNHMLFEVLGARVPKPPTLCSFLDIAMGSSAIA